MPSAADRCITFFSLRSCGPVAEHRAWPACGRFDRVVQWVGNGVATAFFISLERCSCINITTKDDDREEPNDLPLIHDDGNACDGGSGLFRAGEGTIRRRVKGKGKKSGSRPYEDH